MPPGIAIAILAAFLLLPIGAARAATFTVSTTDDGTDITPGNGVCLSSPSNLCTLRAAIQESNALAGDDTVRLPPSTDFYLLTTAGTGEQAAATGDLDVAANGKVVVEGDVGSTPVVDASNLSDRVFEVLAGARLELANLVVTHGSGDGAAVLVGRGGPGGSLSLTGSAFSLNSGDGGTLRAEGNADVDIASSSISGNTDLSQGGAIYASDQSTVTVDGSVLGGNTAESGGGAVFIQNDARLDITLSFLTANTAGDSALGGGAIYNQNNAVSTITDTTLNDNETTGSLGGGAIFNQNDGEVTLTRSTVTGNRALVNQSFGGGGDGGLVYGRNRAELTVVNSTLSGNHADQRGGVLFYGNQAVLHITNSTVTDNFASVAGGASFSDSFQTTPGEQFYFVKNTIVAGNLRSAGPSNCAASTLVDMVTSEGHNLEGTNLCGFDAAGDLVNTDPLLGPLAFNGGFGQTHALLSGSPAIDAGDAVGCPATDQRGVARPQFAGCDIGAFELAPAIQQPPDQTPPLTAIVSAPSGTVSDRTPTFTFTASEAGVSFECSLDGGPFVPCTSPFTTARLAGGPHTFAVRARDAAGNLGPVTTIAFSVAQTLAELTAADPPTLARDVNVAPVGDGPVFVGVRTGTARTGARASQVKGVRFVPLEEASQIPVGSFLDTSRGTVRLQSARNRRGATQSGEFANGIFQVLQSRSRRARGLTELRLKGSSFNRCNTGRRGRAGAAQVSRRTIRRLRSNANGNFSTRGRHSAATVRGTIWITADRCDGTLTTVRRGKVAVRDFRRKRTVIVRAGKSYLARAPQ